MPLGGLARHLEALEVSGEEVCVGHKVVSLRKASSLFVEVLPHVVLPTEAPAARKVVDLLKLVHVFERPEVGAADIEVDVPLAALLHLQETIELQRVYDAFVLRARDLVVQLDLLEAVDAVLVLFVLLAALRVLEEDGRRTILEGASQEMHLRGLLGLRHVLAL